MAEKIIKGDTFIKDGNTNSESLTVNSDKSTAGIAGSIATVKKDSDSDATDVAVFFDVSKINTADQLSAEVYALVSRVVNSVNFNGKGLVGANLVGRNTGNGDFEYINGAFSTASNQGGGNVDFLIANNVKSSVTGSGTCTIDIMRADSGDVEINNINATVNNAQGMHPSVQMTNGTIGEVVGIYVDLDYDNSGSITVTGDIAYIRAGNDDLPTPTGNTYFIKSESPYPSEFAGSIKATELEAFKDAYNPSTAIFSDAHLKLKVPSNPPNNGGASISMPVSSTDLFGITLNSVRRDNSALFPTFVVRKHVNEEIGAEIFRVEETGRAYANRFIKNGSTSDDILLGDGTTTSLNGLANSPVLDTNTTDLITTSTGVDDEVYSFTVPANTFAIGDIIKMRLSGEDTSGDTTNKTMAFQLAGQTVNVTNFISTLYSNNQRFTIDAEIIVTGATTFRYSTNMVVQRNVSGMNTYGNIFEDDKSTGTFDITTTNDITLDLNNAVNGDLVIKTISIKHFKS